MKIPHNYVLIKPDENFGFYQLKGNNTGFATANDGISAGQRLSVRGKIVQLPKKLIFNGEKMLEARKSFSNDKYALDTVRRLKESSVLYNVSIEPSVGDIVFFNYMEHFDCYNNNRFIETEDGDLLLMKYDSFIASHPLNNPKKLRPLNGLVLIEPFQTEKTEQSSFAVVTEKKNENKIQKLGQARILLTGFKCKGYMEDLKAPKDDNELKNGDIIVYKPSGAHLLEWGLHQVLFKGRKVMAIHRNNILMVS